MGGTSASTINRTNRETVNDRGFYKTVGLKISDFRTDANPPALLTGATTPKHVNTSGVNTIQWAGASANASVVTEFSLPWDYAFGITSANKPVHGSLIVGFLIKRTGTNSDSDGIYYGATLNVINPYETTKVAYDGTAAESFKKYTSAGVVVRGDATIVLTGGLTAVSPYERCEVDFTEIFGSSNAVIKPGAAISLHIAGSTTGSDQFDMTGIYIAYRANSGLTSRTPYR